MKRMVLLTAALAVIMVSSSGASASYGSGSGDWDQILDGVPGHLDISVAPDAFRFTLSDILLEGEEAQELRLMMDGSYIGDSDGVVSEGEVSKFEAVLISTLNGMIPETFDLQMVSVDGLNPSSAQHQEVHVESVQIEGAEGDATSTDPITTDVSVLLRFESVDTSRSSHQLRLENVWGDFGFEEDDMDEVPDKEIRVSGYRSWEIQEQTIQPAELQDNLEGGVLIFTAEDAQVFEDEGTALEFEIQGDPNHRMLDDTEEAPAFAPLLIVLAALGGVAALRRRRH